MFVVENPTPDLVLIRLSLPLTGADSLELTSRVREVLARNAPTPTALFTDVRANEAFSPEVEATMIEAMEADNPYVRFAGVLYYPGEGSSSQALKMLQSSRNPARFLSSVRRVLFAWLTPRVNLEELRLINSFIDEGDRLHPQLRHR